VYSLRNKIGDFNAHLTVPSLPLNKVKNKAKTKLSIVRAQAKRGWAQSLYSTNS